MDAPAPPATASQSTPTAAPRDSITTGKSKMSAFGSRLAANYSITLQENSPNWPILLHRLNSTNLFSLYQHIMFEIATGMNRELGAPNLGVAADLTTLRNIVDSVAYDALVATYAVLYNKGRRFAARLFAGMNIPPMTSTEFPIYIAALINSIGPVQRDDVPARRTHVPYLNDGDLLARLPANYQSYLVARFRDKYKKTKMLSAPVESLGTASSAWWTFHPLFIQRSTLPDDTAANLPALPELKLFSPVKYDDVENYLKIATIYGQAPLADPGVGPYSITSWYTRDQCSNFHGEWPNEDDFPVAARNYPEFWDGSASYYARIQRGRFELNEPAAGPPAAPAPGMAPPAPQRRRIAALVDADIVNKPTVDPRVPVVPLDAANYEYQYRMIYFYFDHIVMQNATPIEYKTWTTELVST